MNIQIKTANKSLLFENKTISLVCNGGSLLENNLAEKIDSSDVVIRMNNGNFEYQKFSDRVGKKNHVCCINGWRGFPENRTVPLFNNVVSSNYKYIFFTRHMSDVHFDYFYDCSKKDREIIIPEEKTIQICDSTFEVSKISSGLIVIQILLNSKAKEIKIFGMDFYDKTKKLHFFENHFDANTHNWDFEKTLLSKMIEQNQNITRFV